MSSHSSNRWPTSREGVDPSEVQPSDVDPHVPAALQRVRAEGSRQRLPPIGGDSIAPTGREDPAADPIGRTPHTRRAQGETPNSDDSTINPAPEEAARISSADEEAIARTVARLEESGARAPGETGRSNSAGGKSGSMSLGRKLSIKVKESVEAPSPLPSPDDHDRRAATHEAEHGLHERAEAFVSRGWYFPAKRLLQVGEVQHGKHAEWQDLFYDLIIVAFAFQVGGFLKENLSKPEGALGLVAMGFSTLTSWSHLAAYRARYDAKSPAHRVLDAIEGVLTALAQHNIIADLGRFERVNMYGFLASTLGARVVHWIRRVETAWVVEKGTPQQRTRMEMVARLSLEIVLLCCGFALTDAVSMFILLISIWLLNMLMIAVPVVFGWGVRPKSMVPIHIEYFLARRGELMMLMLGEGVLQIIIGSSPLNAAGKISGYDDGGYDADSKSKKMLRALGEKDDGYGGGGEEYGVWKCDAKCWGEVGKGFMCFTASFMILTAAMYLYYISNPTGHGARHHHATRRSPQRAVLWNATHYPLCLSVLALGVALKIVQPYAAKPLKYKYVLLLATSCAFTVSALGIQKILHPGWKLYRTAPGAPRRLALGLTKVVLAYACLLIAAFPYKTEGYAYVLFLFVIVVVSAVCVVLEKDPHAEQQLWSFVDEHEAKKRRQRRLAKAVRAVTVSNAFASALEQGRTDRALELAKAAAAEAKEQAEAQAAGSPPPELSVDRAQVVQADRLKAVTPGRWRHNRSGGPSRQSRADDTDSGTDDDAEPDEQVNTAATADI